MRRFITACLAGALLVTAACGGGESDGEKTADGPPRTLFQPSGVVGPDSFAPSFAVASYDVPSASTDDATSNPNEIRGTVSGSTPGLYAGRTYGGTGSNICDVEGMISFLTTYEERGRAWAATQGIGFDQLGAYLRDLTPVFTLVDINVTMFGFKNGSSYGYPAVMEVGTAILVDDQGMPRARCACGNPLLGPSEDIPDGTDEPTPDENGEGNPETQDSVPPETGDVPDDQPGDQPRADREPECPDWNDPPPQYVDTNGMLWQFDPSTERWISVDDPSLVNVPVDELPGFLDLCGDPQREFVPECPYWNPLTGQWAPPAEFIDATGQRWIWQSDTDEWAKVDSFDRSALIDIPGFVEICLDPYDSEPQCPSQYKDQWTPYQNAAGEIWIWVQVADQPGHWQNESSGVVVQSEEEIPGYIEECGRGVIENPCPPLYPYFGQEWTDSTGNVWFFTEIIVDGVIQTGWENATTGTRLDNLELYAEYCGDPYLPENPTPLCPPTRPALNDVWIDTSGNSWIFAPNKGGVDGWDNVSTDEVEVLQTSELTDTPVDCGDPTPTNGPDCPPIAQIPEGRAYHASNGSTYVFTPEAGGWVGDAGDVISYTVLLPGYRAACLPPCPPADAHQYDSMGIWVDPSTGHIWIKPPSESVWVNVYTRDVIADTRLLPFWDEECLPPCAPGTSGEPTFVKDEDGRPILDPALDGRYGNSIDSAVTIEPSDEPIATQEIVQELLGIVIAVGDDCNPNGCVDLTREPALGHVFLDSYGVAWRYVGEGFWQSESGDRVDSVLNVPGYTSYCLGEDVSLERDCPEEVEGDHYTDSRNITWRWVGGNPTPEGSDHGQKWFTRFDDGSVEYRYTFQLETFFAGCPKPDGLDLPDDVVMSLRAPSQACVGETVVIKVVVRVLFEGTTFEHGVAVDGDEIVGSEVADGVWIHEWVADAEGFRDVTGSITTSNGSVGEYLDVIDVVECLDPIVLADVDNGDPTLLTDWKAECIELDQNGRDVAVLRVSVSGLDGDPVTITVNGGDPFGDPQIVFPEQQRDVSNADRVEEFTFEVNADHRMRTFEFVVEASDGATSLNATTYLAVMVPSGCSFDDGGIDDVVDERPTPSPDSDPMPEPEPEPNDSPDVSYDLSPTYSGGVCEVRVSAVDTDRGQTVHIGAHTGEARSSTNGEVSRVYRVAVTPTGWGSLPAGHRAFDSAGASVPLSFSVVLDLVSSITDEYRCVRG